ncbi:MAG: CCA tRNA nucleotidyltransferase [Pirellulales bacterium]
MLKPFDDTPRYRFALEVVQTLHEQGHLALFAGGSVRDHLLGKPPKDFDVATDAVPERVRKVFRRRRTLAIGAAFGVISVVGPKGAGQVDVVTFREESDYQDGRRPGRVCFSTPQLDAQRRDFTINGLFYDPLARRVIDYVGGEADLAAGLVRAIGDPTERFAEDKLRMLRAVRFAAALEFELDAATREAASAMAEQVAGVSPERIAGELRRMLVDRQRARAIELLRETGQLAVILPELAEASRDASGWSRRLAALAALDAPEFPLALAVLLRGTPPRAGREAGERLRLSNQEADRIVWLLQHEQALADASALPWPRLQRLLLEPGIHDLLALHEAASPADERSNASTARCREILARPQADWNPPPLVGGDDLKRAGIPPGPQYRALLDQLRDAQLRGEIRTAAEALSLAARLLGE